ncbi:hypothetical protein LEP1GSC052_2895 [Leptospira kmetyi serovar Malaysia str. Bejo-Iso9]|nr:hypothetical protein LEP1GSC052_2895 [Leptospira kmetyi serovar Malaysia str. Bejo-Iso9]
MFFQVEESVRNKLKSGLDRVSEGILKRENSPLKRLDKKLHRNRSYKNPSKTLEFYLRRKWILL